jgi:hypothetical protein
MLGLTAGGPCIRSAWMEAPTGRTRVETGGPTFAADAGVRVLFSLTSARDADRSKRVHYERVHLVCSNPALLTSKPAPPSLRRNASAMRLRAVERTTARCAFRDAPLATGADGSLAACAPADPPF